MDTKNLGVMLGGVAAVVGLAYARSKMSGSRAEIAIDYEGKDGNQEIPSYMRPKGPKVDLRIIYDKAEAVEDLLKLMADAPLRERDELSAPASARELRAAEALEAIGHGLTTGWGGEKSEELQSIGYALSEFAKNEKVRRRKGLTPKGPFEAMALMKLDGSPAHLEMIRRVYAGYGSTPDSSYR